MSAEAGQGTADSHSTCYQQDALFVTVVVTASLNYSRSRRDTAWQFVTSTWRDVFPEQSFPVSDHRYSILLKYRGRMESLWQAELMQCSPAVCIVWEFVRETTSPEQDAGCGCTEVTSNR